MIRCAFSASSRIGDTGGNFCAVDAATGQKLWGQKIGGGVITYTVNGTQKVAVASGYASPALPAEIRRAKIAILGVEEDVNRQ
jgi:alcohol dehydrogenase (cytochrome c)